MRLTEPEWSGLLRAAENGARLTAHAPKIETGAIAWTKETDEATDWSCWKTDLACYGGEEWTSSELAKWLTGYCHSEAVLDPMPEMATGADPAYTADAIARAENLQALAAFVDPDPQPLPDEEEAADEAFALQQYPDKETPMTLMKKPLADKPAVKDWPGRTALNGGPDMRDPANKAWKHGKVVAQAKPALAKAAPPPAAGDSPQAEGGRHARGRELPRRAAQPATPPRQRGLDHPRVPEQLRRPAVGTGGR